MEVTAMEFGFHIIFRFYESGAYLLYFELLGDKNPNR